MLGMEGNVERGTTQNAEYLTLSGFALSHSQEVHRHFVHCSVPTTQWGVSATEDFYLCPYTPPHLHEVTFEVHSPWFVWIPPGQTKSPLPFTGTTVRCTFSVSFLWHWWILVSLHTTEGRGCPVSSSMVLFCHNSGQIKPGSCKKTKISEVLQVW